MILFRDTLLYVVINIPANERQKCCLYLYMLKAPFLLIETIILIPVAIAVDTYFALAGMSK